MELGTLRKASTWRPACDSGVTRECNASKTSEFKAKLQWV